MVKKLLKFFVFVGLLAGLAVSLLTNLKLIRDRNKKPVSNSPRGNPARPAKAITYKGYKANLKEPRKPKEPKAPKEPKEKKPRVSLFSQVLITAGILIFIAAGGIGAYSLADDYLASRRAQGVLDEFMSQIVFPSVQDAVASTLENPSSYETLHILEDLPDIYLDFSVSEQEEVAATAAPTPRPNYAAIGILSIPKLKLELPVLDECDDRRLKVSVCMYLGSADGSPRRMVIAGHRYNSHFGRLHKLETGEEVHFTGLDGVKYSYKVTGQEDISATDQRALASGDWDITLFTCNYNGTRRILVRLKGIENAE